MATVGDIDVWAKMYYCGQDQPTRSQAESMLREATADVNLIVGVMQQSSNPYALMYVSLALVPWFKDHYSTMPPEEVTELFNTFQQAVQNICLIPEVPRYVAASVIQSLCKITKLTFAEEPFQPTVINAMQQLLSPNTQASERLRLVALDVLNEQVKEFCLYNSSRSQTYMNFATHRRCSNNFRDRHLLSIFVAVTHILPQVNAGHVLTPGVVELLKSVLTYDFMAIIVDETEDALSAQFPTSWKDAMFQPEVFETLWGQHRSLPPPLCTTMLQGLCAICGTRRTFFDNQDEKMTFIDFCLEQLSLVSQANDGRLNSPMYCAALAEASTRIISPYGYRELANSRMFPQWISMMSDFTLRTINIPFGSEGSFATMQTLLQFWSRMCNSKRMYLNSEDKTRDVETLIPNIAGSFFQTRTTPNNFDVADEEITEAIQSQADTLPALCYLEPNPIIEIIIGHLQNVGTAIVESPGAMGWLFYLSGNIVRCVLQFADENNIGLFSCLMQCVVEYVEHRRDVVEGNDFVETACLFFLTNLHNVAVASRLNAHLQQIVGNVFGDKAKLFQFILTNVGENVLRPALITNVHIMRQSIQLILEACRDAPGDLLVQVQFNLPPVVDLPLSQHQGTYKLRTDLHSALYLLKVVEPYQQEALQEFLAPIDNLINETASGRMTMPLFVAGWLRDLRGVCRTCAQTQASFSDFVDWIVDRTNLFSLLAGTINPAPIVTISFLRFVSELVTASGTGKVNLPTSSHSGAGVVLFRFVSTMLQRVLDNVITNDQIEQVQSGTFTDGVYSLMLKPLMLCMETMKKCIHGDFVPFGAMALYHDNTFNDTCAGLLKFLQLFPSHSFKEYPKVSYTATDLLRSLVECQVYSPLTQMGNSEFMALIEFCLIIANDVETPTPTLLHSLTFLGFISTLIVQVKQQLIPNDIPRSPAPAANRISRKIKEDLAAMLVPHMDLWSQLILTAMNIITCQDRALSPCCSIVFPIFDADPTFWHQFSDHFIRSYPMAKHAAVAQALSDLSADATSCDKFFSSVFHFRNVIRSL